MTVKELKIDFVTKYLEIINSRSECDIPIDDLKDLNLSLVNISSSIINYISLNETVKSIAVNLGETEELSYSHTDEEYEEDEKGFVYIAKQTNEKNLYKIGITKNLSTRESTFKTGNIFVKIIASMNHSSYKLIEKELHSRLSKYRVQGEWFSLDDDRLKAITKALGFSFHVG